jgi:hypothetical protein
MKYAGALALLTATSLTAQADLKPLAFLEGTWDAKTTTGAAAAGGTYTFAKELNGHVLARHSSAANHADLLYIYPEGAALRAIFFDNEGHTIHYTVSTPDPHTAVFLSGQFRLVYELKDGVMSGKFQMHSQTGWKSYLEWTGPKKP